MLHVKLSKRYRVTRVYRIIQKQKEIARRSSFYRKWYQLAHSNGFRTSITTGCFALVITVLVLHASTVLSAVNSWTQTDWSGGQGASIDTQFSSQTNIDFSNSGEIRLQSRYSTGAFSGNQLSDGSSNFNTSTPTSLGFNVSQNYNDDAFSYDGGSVSRVVVDDDGDYFISLTQTLTSSGGSVRNSLISEIWVNGAKAPVGNGSSSFIRNTNSHVSSSNHLGVLLEDLSAGDYIEVYVYAGTTTLANTLTGNFTLYTEKIASGENVFSASSVAKTSGSNLNTAQAAMTWTERRKDSGFSHSDSTNPGNITIANPGNYFVTVNIPLTSTSQRPNIIGRVKLDGVQVDGGQFQQGYIRNAESHTQASIHWSGIVTTVSSNQILTVTSEIEAISGTVTVGSDVATIFIMETSPDSIYLGEATQNSSGNDWAPSSTSTASWATDEIIDTTNFTHDVVTNNHQVTVDSDGDYLLSFNLASSGGGQRTTPNISISVNGTPVTGAQSLTGYARNASSHDSSSNNLLFPLINLTAGDVITVEASNGSNVSGIMNDDTPVQLMLWKKGYYATGSVVSNIYDANYDVNWGDLTYTTGGVGSVEVRVRTDSASNMSGAPDFSTCDPIVSGTDITSNNCVTDGQQYVQYEVQLIASGGTPTFDDITIDYVAVDQTAPVTNATNIAMYKSNGGSSVTESDWTNAATPYFTWDAGADNIGGTGISGYCLYLGQDDTANPVTTKGLLGTSPSPTYGDCQFKVDSNSVDLGTAGYIETAMTTSASLYYLNVKAIDLAGNVYSGSSAQFEFLFDKTSPVNPLYIAAPSQFVSDKLVDLTWSTVGSGSPSDANSGLAGLQYRIGNGGTWYGDSHTGAQDETDLLANDGTYTTQDPIDFDELIEGNNVVYFRTWDNAGNVSAAHVTTIIKLNTVSPTPVQNVTATPTTNTVNSFSFSWLAPASFTGNENQITYCYVFNALPTQTNCSFTAAGVTSLPVDAYATQPGDNVIYVVAKDEAGNINYASYGYETFTANTPAPGIAQNVEVADISVKQTSNWKIAMSWEAPLVSGAGVSKYIVSRSTDDVIYSDIATTTATSYVDQGLSQVTYYYKVKACDSANNCGAQTAAATILPTGRYTTAATLITQPSAINTSTRKATIEWITDRTSDSKISIGTTSGVYSPEEISNSAQVTKHSLQLSSLEPGTTYYYITRWTDEDGNTGISTEKTFTTLPAPTVKDVSTLRIGLDSATLEFTSTNATSVKLYYGKSENFGGLKTVNTSVASSTYSIEVDGLDDGTEYFYKLNPVDSDGNEYNGTILSFTTPLRPRISNFAFQPVEGEPTSTQEITWTTNVPATSALTYGKLDSAGFDVRVSKLVTEHSIVVNGLEDDSEYFVVAQSRDASGNLAESDRQVFRTALDTRSPRVFDITFETSIRGVGVEARGQVVVSWKTDEPATSQVAYTEGSSTQIFNSRTAEESELSTEHIVVVSDLPTSRVYSLQPISRDKSGNTGTGSPDTIIIGRASESVLTTIFNTLQRVFGI